MRRSTVAATAVLCVLALTVTVLALRFPGIRSSDVDVNDGGVWIVNSSDGVMGRLNVEARELDARIATVGDDLDIEQSGYTLVETGARGFSPINTSSITRAPMAETPPGSTVHVGADRIVVAAPDGRVWVLTRDSAASFAAAQTEPVYKGDGSLPTVAVAEDGTAFVLDKDKLITVPAGNGDPSASEPKQIGGLTTDEEKRQLTVVGSTPVILDAENRLLRIGEKGRSVDLTPQGVNDLTAARLQQPSGHSDHVLLALPGSLVSLPLSGGKATITDVGGTGEPAEPVQASDCDYGVWNGSMRYLTRCGDQEAQAEAVPKASGGADLVLRRNRDLVVLNDQQTGMAWMISQDMQLVDEWSITQPIKTEQEQETEEETVTSTIENIAQERDEENRPPVAHDDAFGVRAGQNVVLPVVRNDTDPDGDVLTVALKGEQPALGTVSTIRGGTQLQITMAEDASGTGTFTYEVDDGRGGQDTATVTLTVHAPEANKPPQPADQSLTQVQVRSGKSVSLNVLPYWQDPEGDAFYLADATMEPEDVVTFRPDGLVTIDDAGLATGTKQVSLTFRDEQGATAEGVLEVEAVESSDLAPVTTADHIQVTTGSRGSIRPLANDINPAGGDLELTNVSGADGLTVEPDLLTGTVTVAGSAPGAYYLEYTVGAGGASSLGLIRVDVVDPSSEGLEPVAVDDLGLVTTGGSVLVDPLENDVDPTGGVLVVNSVQGTEGTGLKATVIGHHLVRIEAEPGAEVSEEPVPLTYEVANEAGSTTGRIRVMVAATDTQFANPVPAPDDAVVRAGDMVMVDVLANDLSPTHSPLRVSRLLDTSGADALGHAEVHRDQIRFTAAPGAAGEATLTYEVIDETGRTASARATITVTAEDAPNTPPRPENLEARTVSGQSVRIPLTTTGVDADGDSVMLMGITSPAPTLGEVTSTSGGWIEYIPHEGAVGTDRFRYQVMDRYGAVGTAEVLVGIARPSSLNQPPFAIDDTVDVRPDRVVQVPVLDNDTDPEGSDLAIVHDQVEPTTDIEVLPPRSDRSDPFVTVQTPSEPGTHTVLYSASDGQLSSPALVTFRVDPNAPQRAPIAYDDFVSASDVLTQDAKSIAVDVLANDRDPDGTTEKLTVALDDPDSGTTLDGSVVHVTPREEQQRIRYTITDQDDLSSSGYIWVPGTSKQAPVWVGGELEVREGSSVSVDLSSPKNVTVRPGGSPARITDPNLVDAAHDDGSGLVVDESTLEYRPQEGFTGEDSITVEVADGAVGDDTAATGTLSIPVTVLPAEGNSPPEFRGAVLDVELGGPTATLDLTTSADDADGDALSFAEGSLPPMPDGVSVEVQGDQLRATATPQASKGEIIQVPVTVSDGDNDPVEATFQVVVGGSKRPLAAPVRDTAEVHAGSEIRLNVLENDSNPFPEKPLTLEGAELVAGKGTVNTAGDQVVITPDPEFAGVLTASYTVLDATGDPERRRSGEVRLTVLGKPEAPSAPRIGQVGDGTVELLITPGADNGSPITGYTVTSASGPPVTAECESTSCTIDGLVNGTEYTFQVVAHNAVGDSPASAASAPARPDVRPEAPAPPSVERGDGELQVSWSAPKNRGSALQTYTLQMQNADTGALETKKVPAATTSLTWSGLKNGVSYRFRVQAANLAEEPSDFSGWSSNEHPAGPPKPPSKAPSVKRVNDPLGGGIEVSWPEHTEAQTNGEPITAYVVHASDGSTHRVDGKKTSLTVRGLDQDTEYSFHIVAQNSVGSSSPGPASKKLVPFAVPTAPGKVTAQAPPGTDPKVGPNGVAHVSWTEADGRGTPITQYVITWDGGSKTVDAKTRSATITGLKNGTSYTFTVQARNGHTGGEGPVARSNSWTPFTAPAKPKAMPRPYTCPKDGPSCSITYDVEVVNDGGKPIEKVEYRITAENGWSGGWGELDVSSGRGAFTIKEWPMGQTITVDVRLTNSEGLSTTWYKKVRLDPGASGP